MFEPKLRVSRELMGKLARAARAAGYASVDEFATHALEKAVAAIDAAADDEDAQIEDRLRGLGYIE